MHLVKDGKPIKSKSLGNGGAQMMMMMMMMMVAITAKRMTLMAITVMRKMMMATVQMMQMMQMMQVYTDVDDHIHDDIGVDGDDARASKAMGVPHDDSLQSTGISL